jgi:hypothetical protein
MVKGSSDPVRMYTCDIEVSSLKIDERKEIKTSEELRKARVR